MAIEYELLSPRHVVLARGAHRRVGEIARRLDSPSLAAASATPRAFVVTGSRFLESAGVVDEIERDLRAAGLGVERVARAIREPELEDVDELVARLRSAGAGPGDRVIAIGGGSAIDLAKAGAALATQRPDPSRGGEESAVRVVEYLEGVGTGRSIHAAPLPLLAVPTTAGTGSEATKNAVISSSRDGFKKSLRDARMVPAAVVIDPELAVSLPPQRTAETGMDAVTQLIESFISRRARRITRAFALEGLALALAPQSDGGCALVAAVRDGGNLDARESMAHAAFLSGWALANSGLGMAHGVAAALGAVCGVRHGLACAVLLPVAMRANLGVSLTDLARIGELVTGRNWPTPDAAAMAGIERVEELARSIGIPARLAEIGVARTSLDAVVPRSRGNSMSGNPRDLDDDELRARLEQIA